MGFFYGGAQDTDGYLDKIANINALGAPKDLLKEVDLTWAVALRLAQYNPVQAKQIMNEVTTKELYEAYLMYAFDTFQDG